MNGALIRALSDHGARLENLETNEDLPSAIVGEIRLWPAITPPTRWKLCNGEAVSRTVYSAVFGVIGITYGDGDESTTFNLPNMTPYGGIHFIIYTGVW